MMVHDDQIYKACFRMCFLCFSNVGARLKDDDLDEDGMFQLGRSKPSARALPARLVSRSARQCLGSLSTFPLSTQGSTPTPSR